MIALFLTALDQQGHYREFSCLLSSLEANFDLLNRIIAQGDILLSAYVMEDTTRTDLPVAAFDGLPASSGIRTLEREWQAILNSPVVPRSLHQQELLALTRRRMDQYDFNIAAHERMIAYFDKWLQNTKTTTPPGPTRSYLIQRYECQLAAHQLQLAEVRFRSNLVASRLNQLTVL